MRLLWDFVLPGRRMSGLYQWCKYKVALPFIVMRYTNHHEAGTNLLFHPRVIALDFLSCALIHYKLCRNNELISS
jgi:hypothetical protein